jgi:NADH-quinone oxidoreductase subunit J
MFPTILFYAAAATLIGAAIAVITVRNPVHAVLSLILAFVSSAVLWLLLEVEFLAIVLVLVYVGAVMVLFLFVVMMLDINTTSLRECFARYAPVGAIVAGIVILELTALIWIKAVKACRSTRSLVSQRDDHIRALGNRPGLALAATSVPFEVAAIRPAAGHCRGHHVDPCASARG